MATSVALDMTKEPQDFIDEIEANVTTDPKRTAYELLLRTCEEHLDDLARERRNLIRNYCDDPIDQMHAAGIADEINNTVAFMKKLTVYYHETKRAES
jgi:uncharacterized protein Yka (UPF0111/DUF47 family)